MLRKTHQIDIIVNNEPIELYDPENLNLRLNNVLFEPESMTSKTGEYSFSFEIPATPKNNAVFNFANNMSKLNKFNTLYDCTVNVDGMEIFTGTLRLSDTQEGKYTCNLISLKVNKIDEIFGNTTMNELNWKVDFDGTSTINDVNNNLSSTNELGYYFPLVCYGAFKKKPYAVYGNSVNMYTDLLQIDAFNRWYWESFHPSFSLVELVKRCFEHKGYTLNGDILNDMVLRNIYLSEYIDSSQDPVYNLGKTSIGTLSMNGTFTPGSPLSSRGGSTFGATTRSGGVESSNTESLATKTINTLSYPKEKVYGLNNEYNFDTVAAWDVFATPASMTDPNSTHYMPVLSNQYIYRKADKNSTSGFIVIPADGLYTIELSCSVDISSVYSEFSSVKYTQKKWDGDLKDPGIAEEEIDISSASSRTFDVLPVEIQLVRNTDEPELIWTAENVIKTGNVTGDAAGWTQYPHETNDNALITGGLKGNTSVANKNGNFGGNRNYKALGDRYYVDKGTTIAYDPKVNEGFICGFTTANKSCSVLKNGMSWDKTITTYNQTHYIQPGYKKAIWGGKGSYTGSELTDYNTNSLNCPNTNYWQQTNNTGQGRVTCVVELKKNDKISLKVLTKSFMKLTVGTTRNGRTTYTTNEDVTYNPVVTYNLKLTPYTNKTDKYMKDMNMNYLPSEEVVEAGWGTKLNLGNFLNSKEKMSDFINNFIKTFNLQYNQIGKNVFINKNKLDMVTVRNEVDIDDRVITSEGKASRIDYPGYMEVKWSISDDEAGAYRSIDTVEHQGANNWKDYIDTGSEKVQMDTTNESKSETVDSKWSYTWYQDFTYYDYDRQTGTDNGHVATFRLPIIAKDEDFITQSDKSMNKDGLSLKQRLWFRDQPVQEMLEMWDGSEAIVSIPVNEYRGVTLNFKNEKGSLLDTFFNVSPRTDSNYLTIECYLTPMEYIMLKNGAFTKFDDDLYIVSEIQGYDPSGSNKTELKLIKKV